MQFSYHLTPWWIVSVMVLKHAGVKRVFSPGTVAGERLSKGGTMSDTVAVRELLEGRIFTPLEVSFWQRCDGPTMLDGRTDGTELFAFPSAVSQTTLDGVGADLYALLSHSDAASKVAARHGVVFPPRPPAPVWDENFPGTLGQ